jgi:hypothetical protein
MLAISLLSETFTVCYDRYNKHYPRNARVDSAVLPTICGYQCHEFTPRKVSATMKPHLRNSFKFDIY